MEPPVSFGHYMNAWNEVSPDLIRGHLERALADGARFVDPANTRAGIDEIEALMRELRAAFPNSSYALTTGIDGHNRRYRYRWVARLDETNVVNGMDVTTIDPDGLITEVVGFFGEFPPA